jgi:two-component system alkaline phosphatase synthesis response regulator PhoP
MRSSVPAARPKAKILYVEDDIDLQKSVSFILWKEGYQILCAETGGDAIELARQEKPDLILLDLLLPGIDGHKVCNILKRDAATANTAIIMVTARKQVKDVVAGFKEFADDYITKPFEPEILLARIQALLRRRIKLGEKGTSIIKVDDLVIRPDAYEVFVSGKKACLSRPNSISWLCWRGSQIRSSPVPGSSTASARTATPSRSALSTTTSPD